MVNTPTGHQPVPPGIAPSRPLQHYSTPIPAPVSSIIGRSREINLALRLIRDPDVRLLTLTGPGGVGKTRLALHVARTIQAGSLQNVAYVELGAVSDAQSIPQTIAQALDIREVPDLPIQAQIKDVLHDHSLLLVLDNFEHLINAAPTLIDLLTGCPNLTLLVTSRVVLNLSGEHVMHVPPLDWRQLHASPGQGPTDQVASSAPDAVRLFVERARAIDPSFTDTAADAAIIAEICARLDGLPLAIEMAAARSYLLSPPELLERLEHRLPLLTGGPRDLPARQSTMRDTIAWSYDLLDPEERAVLRRLSVFVGAWSLDAATEVCWDIAVDPVLRPSSVLPVIESLVRKSMVERVPPRKDGGPGNGPLFRLLETIREFTQIELFTANERNVIRERHANYYAAAAERLVPIFWGDRPGNVRAIIAAEIGNYRAALDWALDHKLPEQALRIVGAIYTPEATHDLSRLLGHTISQLELVDRALALPGGSDNARALALCKASHLADANGDSVRAMQLADDALERSRKIGDPQSFATAAYVKGRCAFRAGDLAEARQWLEQASRAFEEEGAHGRAAWAQCMLASIESCTVPVGAGHEHPELVQAARRCDAALTVFQATAHSPGITRAMAGKAYIAYKQGAWVRALTYLHDLLTSAWAEGRVVLNCVEDIADIAARLDQPVLAAQLYGAIEADRRAFGQVVPPVFGGEVEAELDAVRRQLGDEAFSRHFDAGRAMPIERAVAKALAFAAEAIAPAPIRLTPREQGLLPLLVENLTAQEMADRLFLSRRTVETHLANLYAKLGVHSRAEALAAASAAGLLSSHQEPDYVTAGESQ